MKKLLLLSLFLMCTLLQQVMAQDRTISGTVIDRQSNTGLPGVTVLVKGTTIGTNTDMNGAYTLTVPAGSNTLEYRFIGYQTVERTIGNESNIDVTLATDTRQLGEVVVTALGIEREKKQLGYATQNLDNETLTQGRDRSVINAMQGKVAGVQISNQGGIGASSRVVIRGSRSIGRTNQPLYVIDGVPIDNSSYNTGDNLNNNIDAGNRANDVNPEDVESINILKGPAAAALYGSRAANGAIIITTKSGRSAARAGNKAEITYTTSYQIESILRIPELQNRFGQGTDLNQPDYRENWSWGPKLDGVVRPWGRVVDGQQRIKPYVALPTNVKEFFENGRTYTNSLQVAGGDEKSNYILSMSNVDQKGILPTDHNNYGRTTVKVGGEVKLTNKFTSSANLTYTKTGGDLIAAGQGQSVYTSIINTPRDISLLEQRDLDNKFNTPTNFYNAYYANPYQILRDDRYENDVDRIFGNIQLGYSFMDNLKLTYRLGTDVYSDKRRQFKARRISLDSRNQSSNEIGYYGEAQYSNREVNSDLMLNYFKDINEDFNINVLVGHNINQRSYNNIAFSGINLVNNSFQGFTNLRGQIQRDPYAPNLGRQLQRLHGVYGTIDLGFRDYLFVGLTARNDWSSTLAPGNRSFFYPAISTGFVFTEALGLENNILSYGKIRANYAQVGNDAPPYLLQPIFTQTSISGGFPNTDLIFPINDIAAYEQGNTIANPNIQPEITKSLELGAELRFLNDRIGVDFSYYKTNSTDQIINVPISGASGFRSITQNAGLLTNKGIEILLSLTPVKTDNLEWTVNANYSRNRNRVMELFPGVSEITIGGFGGGTGALVATEGQLYGNFKATTYRYAPDGKIIVGPDGIPLSSLAPEIVGNIQANYLAGLTNSINYKGLNFTFTFDTKQGGDMYSRTRNSQRFTGTDPTTLYNDRQPFVVPNSVIQTEDGAFIENTTPVEAWNYWAFGLPDATNFIDASYVKLREVSLTYNLPKTLIERTPFGNVQIGVSGRNLALWTPAENTYVDPEISNFGNGNVQGFDLSGSPSLRSYGASLRVTF